MSSAVKFEQKEIVEAFDLGKISLEEKDKLISDITPALWEEFARAPWALTEMDRLRNYAMSKEGFTNA